MFSKGKEPPPQQANAAPPKAEADETVIGNGITIKGEVGFTGNLRIDGYIEAPITGDGRLSTGPNSQCVGDCHAVEIRVGGVLHGNVTATTSIHLDATAQVVGNLQAPKVVIAEGAALQGQLMIGAYDDPPAE